MTLRVMKISKIEKIGLIFAVLFVALAFVSVGIASAATIYVPDNYQTIQEAVDNASAGETIIVRDGTYIENVDVNKRLTIRSENGSDKTIIRAVNPYDHVFEVTAGYVNISGFIVKGASGQQKAGIYLGSGVDHCNISNNNASNNYYGIYLYYSSNNVLTKNTMSGNDYNFGINGRGISDFIHNIDTSNKVDGKPIYYWINEQDLQIPGDAGFVGLVNSTNILVKDLTLAKNEYGMLLAYSNNSWIENVTTSNNKCDGIYLHYSSSNVLTNNNASNNSNGIRLWSSDNNNLANNNVNSNKINGIILRYSRNNTITSNTANSNENNGIYLCHSSNNSLANNTMSGNSYNFHVSGTTLFYYIQNVDISNLVDGKPVYYLVNKQDQQISNVAGYVGLINCTNVTVKDLTLMKNGQGALFAYTTGSRIENVTASNNWCGIYLKDSSNNNITNSTISYNRKGIYLKDSSNNNITNSTISYNRKGGIYLGYSSHNTIANNDVFSNEPDLGPGWWVCVGHWGYGIELFQSYNSIIANNKVKNNWDGISLRFSRNSILVNNYLYHNYFYGTRPSGYCNGIELQASSNSIILNNTAISNEDGIDVTNSNNCTVTNNTVVSNEYGIKLSDSNNCKIANNSVSSNSKYGIRLYSSSDNVVYLNNFINNIRSVNSSFSNNIWNSTEKIHYTYNGSKYKNYLGNYWSDYTGNDTDENGIGDTSYRIDGDKDNHPLMQPWQNYFPEENKAIETKNPKLAFSAYYHPTNISVNLSVPPYPLPLNLSNVTNIDEINTEFWLNERQKELLRTNGFVITDYGYVDDIGAPYEDMKERDIPIFVTTDTLLHLYHIQFNEILKGIEEREFFDDLVDMSNAMLLRSIQDYENFTDPELKEAARRNVAYFAVALKLLHTPTEGYNSSEDIKAVNFTVPDYVKEDVEKEIENIEKHDGFHPSYIFNSDPNRKCEDECCYCEDYSQYIPRGHYTRSEKLKRYFKAMMWYGRIAFLLKGGNVSECSGIETPLIREEDAKIATIQAALISSELPTVEVENKTAQELWNRIYSVTAFFVGTADDLTPYEYQKAIGDVFGSEFDATELIDGEKILRLKAELAKLRSPEIYGGSGVCVVYPPITREKLHECLAKTKGLRFMGQRFVPDSYMFQQLVSPAVGMYVGNDTPFTMCLTDAGPARCFPRGLDIMAVLGSERAADILIEEGDTEYAGINTSYDEQLEELKSQFAGFDITEWNRNLYWSWLYTLKPLLKQFGDGYPTFMQTKAWQEKELQTSLASWTELRHDTILYAKQSYTPPLKSMPPQQKPVVGYVEPVPEFYARLLALTEMTENGLIDLDVLNETEKARLQSLERILERLIDISKAELENKELAESDYEFIRNFGDNLDSVVAGVNTEGKETTIVADVHTDCNTEMVLEEGVGYVNLILVAYSVPDGRIIVGAGPVFSYYEFKQPMDDRLTDEKWKEMLERNPPERPGWAGGIEG